MKKVVILMGVPGSGKGTQAKKIAEMFGYKHVSSGNLLRDLVTDPEASLVDKQKLEEMRAGKLVSNDLIYKLVEKEIKNCHELGIGMVMDGVSRSVEQAKHYQDVFKKFGLENSVLVIEIRISDETVMKRLQIRLETDGKQRPDDEPEIMQQRLREQGNVAIKPILNFYDELGILVRVDGEPPVTEVEKQIREVLAK